ncbi:MAG: carboxypeptidase-like regulatory domain-containing protein [Planctomycetota bacterium]|jgi:hypothetical protein
MRSSAAILLLTVASWTGEWVEEYEGYLPGGHGSQMFATLVVDERTGEPLPGATLRIYKEDIRPEAFPGRFVEEFKADRYGVVWLRWEERFFDCHFVFDHPGYAAEDEYADVPLWVGLAPGREVRGRILGAPAGIEVEYYLGCPHSPAVRRATTDAEGRFFLQGIDPLDGTCWAIFPGTSAAYLDPALAPTPDLSWEPFRLAWGVTVSGRVEDEGGDPVPGVVVQSPQTFRGPRTVTDERGRFRLDGVESGSEIRFHVKDGRNLRPTWVRSGSFPGREPEPGPTVNRIRIRPPGDEGRYEFWLDWDERFESEQETVVEIRTARTGALLLRFEHEAFGGGGDRGERRPAAGRDRARGFFRAWDPGRAGGGGEVGRRGGP